MTLFINFRAGTSRALARRPRVIRREVLGPGKVEIADVSDEEFSRLVRDLRLAIVTHGFNVDYAGGVRSLGRIEEALDLGPGWLFVGVLWPGDSWVPFVNYPAEARDAALCGRRLAEYLNRWAAHAGGFAFASHSLGARVVLEAVLALSWKSSGLCMTAAAADDDCLTEFYAGVRGKTGRISVLASTRDLVLQLAYPAGDLVSDIAYDDDSPWRPALGRRGTKRPAPPEARNFQIPPASNYGHLDYFPGGKGDPPSAKEQRVMRHLAHWFREQGPDWP